jgi:arsenate reductase
MNNQSSSIVIHHNPDCGTSRNVVAAVRAAGYEPTLVEYLKTGWTKPQLLALFAAARLTPRTALRTTKSPAAELGLLDENVSDKQLLEAMIEYPVLVNRPIVCSEKGVRLCRPSERIADLLPELPDEPVYKEDGELLLRGKPSEKD